MFLSGCGGHRSSPIQEAPAPGMVIQYQAGRVHRALCLEPVGSEGIPGTPSGCSSIVQTSPAKYNLFPEERAQPEHQVCQQLFLQPKIKLETIAPAAINGGGQ